MIQKTPIKAVVDNVEFYISEEDARSLDIHKIDDHSFHVIKNNICYSVNLIDKLSNSEYKIRVNNVLKVVKLSNSVEQLIDKMGLAAKGNKIIREIKAPMPGLVLKIMAAKDQEVIKGQNILILEAMKMENVISSPVDGIIESISLTMGQSVEKNQVLVTFKA